MQPIAKEYLLLFNAITDAEKVLCELRAKLIEVQQQAEELFLEDGSCLQVQQQAEELFLEHTPYCQEAQ